MTRPIDSHALTGYADRAAGFVLLNGVVHTLLQLFNVTYQTVIEPGLLGAAFSGFVEMFAIILTLGMITLTFAAAFNWMRWIHRVTTIYIEELGHDTSTTPGMAAASYVIPFLNAFQPYLHIREMWQQLATGEDREDLFTVHAWWAGLVVTVVCKIAWLVIGDSYVVNLALDLTAAFAYGVATYGAVLIARQITAFIHEALDARG